MAYSELIKNFSKIRREKNSMKKVQEAMTMYEFWKFG